MIRWIFGDKGTIEGEKPSFDRETRKIIRSVFNSENGRKALTYLLTDLGYFDQPIDRNGEQLTGEALVRYHALQGFARHLLEIMGILHEGHAEELVNQMMNLPVWERKDQQEES